MWIKERESSHNLQVVRMGAPSTVTAMERAMEAGHSVLIDNMGENIDAVLNPVITRSTFKKVIASDTCKQAGSLHACLQGADLYDACHLLCGSCCCIPMLCFNESEGCYRMNTCCTHCITLCAGA